MMEESKVIFLDDSDLIDPPTPYDINYRPDLSRIKRSFSVFLGADMIVYNDAYGRPHILKNRYGKCE